MSRQVTITLSDGTPPTGTLDPDGFLLLPRGKKPAEPWWSRCEADPQGQSDKPHGLSPIAVPVPCGGWEWHDDEWFRIRPLPGESWESIAPQQRDYTNWQEGLGDSAKPDDFDANPGKYEVAVWDADVKGWDVYTAKQTPMWWGGLIYRVRLRQSEPQGETDGEFALRWLRLHKVIIKDGDVVFTLDGDKEILTDDVFRAARLIAEAKA